MDVMKLHFFLFWCMHINQNLDESNSIVLSFSLAYRFLCFLYLVLLHLIVLIVFLSYGMSAG